MTRRRQGVSLLSEDAFLVWLGIIAFTLFVSSLWVGVHGGWAMHLRGADAPLNPVTLVVHAVNGKVEWPGWTGWLAVVMYLSLLGVVGLRVYRHQQRRPRHAHAARRMGSGREIRALSERAVAEKAQRMSVDAPGLPIGLHQGRMLWSSWEDTMVAIAGTRVGKTTSLVVPRALAAPGALLVTSNKPDIVSLIGPVRSRRGRVWLFDPQGVSGAASTPTWAWNPLGPVIDEVSAQRLAEHFAMGSRQVSATADAFFDGQGKSLLAAFFLALALDDRPIGELNNWLAREGDNEPVGVLRRHRPDSPFVAQLQAQYSAPDRQRGGVFATATQFVQSLSSAEVLKWVTPSADRPALDVEEFVAASEHGHADTIISLSREGVGSVGPLVTALTVAVSEAAERAAARESTGRLRVPLLLALDEAANICRWRDLPDLYSHFGSRGIVVDAILQSWSQGVDVWGATGMAKLWSAANVNIYAGGSTEEAFLQSLSQLIGDADETMRSVSYSRGMRSTNQHVQRQRIMDVSDLAALELGDAVVLASGSVPTIVKLVPWMKGPHAAAIEAARS